MVPLEDAISMTLVVANLAPLLLTCYNTKFFVLFIAVTFVWLSVEAIKPFIHSPRPPHAIRCDRWCQSGPSGGNPGFPSGHMASVAVFVTLLYFYVPSIPVLIAGLTWLMAMAWSRYKKQCHTIHQILGGTVYGILCAVAIHSI